MAFVVDASCLAKLVVTESSSREFRDWFAARLKAGERLTAPPLVVYELGRAIERALPGAPPELLEEYLGWIVSAVAIVEPPMGDTFGLSASGLTFYDASFVALAQDTGATLVSADEAMLELAGMIGVPTVTF